MSSRISCNEVLKPSFSMSFRNVLLPYVIRKPFGVLINHNNCLY